MELRATTSRVVDALARYAHRLWHGSHFTLAIVARWTVSPDRCPHELRLWRECPRLYYPERTERDGRRFKCCRICGMWLSRKVTTDDAQVPE